MYPSGIRTRNPSKRVAAGSCQVLNIISIVYVAVSVQEIQGLTVGWGLQHHVSSAYTKYVFKYSDLYNSVKRMQLLL